MAQINLLPWREQARQEKKIQFFIILGACIGFTVFLIVIFHFYLSSLISDKNARITFLQTALGTQQSELNSLKDKKKKQNVIEADLNFLNKLQEKSFLAIRLMSELTHTVPTTITLEKLTRENGKIILIGKAQSELQITLFMKNISKSPIFYQPVLTRINENPENTAVGRMFELQLEQKERKSL